MEEISRDVISYLKLSGSRLSSRTVRRFRLRIHEEADRRAARSRQRDIVREVVRHPVHLPGPEQPHPRLLHHFVVQRPVPGWFFEHNLTDVRGIDRHPAVTGDVHFGAAMLRLRDVFRRGAEALVPQFRFGDADAIHVARREPRGASQADIERVQIGAFTAEISRLQHEPDIAEAAAARFWIPKCVIDDPLVDVRAPFRGRCLRRW